MMGPFGTNPVHIDSQGNAHVAAVVAQALQPSAAEQKLAAIRKLHVRSMYTATGKYYCAHCRHRHRESGELVWPCPTVAVLDSNDTTEAT